MSQVVPAQPKVWGVRELVNYLKRAFAHDRNISELGVRGELTDHSRSGFGHVYFGLKERTARCSSVSCARSASRIARAHVPDLPRHLVGAAWQGRLSVLYVSVLSSAQGARHRRDVTCRGIGAHAHTQASWDEARNKQGWTSAEAAQQAEESVHTHKCVCVCVHARARCRLVGQSCRGTRPAGRESLSSRGRLGARRRRGGGRRRSSSSLGGGGAGAQRSG